MKHSILWKRVMSCILLLSIIVGILPAQSLAAEERASDPAEGTELSALYDTVAAPANQLTDLRVMMGGKGMTELPTTDSSFTAWPSMYRSCTRPLCG